MSLSPERIEEIRAQAEAERERKAAQRNGHAVEDIPPEPVDVDDHHAGDWRGDRPQDNGPNRNGRQVADADETVEQYDPENAINYRMRVLRVEREARRRLDDEDRPPIEHPPVKSLDALLAEPDTPTRYRIDQVAPAGGRVMLSAQYKAGKTILIGNLLRALADGAPFLGRFDVCIPAAGIVVIDNELSEDTLRRWLREQGIENTSAVADVVALRGKVGMLNLLDDRCRDQWATRLRDIGADYLVLDCLRPVLDALGLDENRDAGKFLVAFDAMLTDAGINDAAVVHHMGHANERARGDSRLQDWPDAIWRMVRETDEPDSPRYFSAFGRDVNIAEGQLGYNPATRHLTYTSGSRVDSVVRAAQRAVIDLLMSASEHMSKSAIEDELSPEHKQKAVREAMRTVVKVGLVAVEPGAHGAKLHRIAFPCSECRRPVVGQGVRHLSCEATRTEEDGLLG